MKYKFSTKKKTFWEFKIRFHLTIEQFQESNFHKNIGGMYEAAGG